MTLTQTLVRPLFTVDGEEDITAGIDRSTPLLSVDDDAIEVFSCLVEATVSEHVDAHFFYSKVHITGSHSQDKVSRMANILVEPLCAVPDDRV